MTTEDMNERWRASSCDGKVAFLTRGTAKAAAARRPGRDVYRCVHCRQWHVGTPIVKKRWLKELYKRNKHIRIIEEIIDDGDNNY